LPRETEVVPLVVAEYIHHGIEGNGFALDPQVHRLAPIHQNQEFQAPLHLRTPRAAIDHHFLWVCESKATQLLHREAWFRQPLPIPNRVIMERKPN